MIYYIAVITHVHQIDRIYWGYKFKMFYWWGIGTKAVCRPTIDDSGPSGYCAKMDGRR